MYNYVSNRYKILNNKNISIGSDIQLYKNLKWNFETLYKLPKIQILNLLLKK